MTKNGIKMCIAAAIVLVLTAGIIIAVNIDTEETNHINTENDTYTIYSEEANNISYIDVIGGQDEIRAVNLGDSVWTINDFAPDEVDTAKAYGIAGTVAQMISKNKIAENPSDLSQYGLDTPSLTVVITKKNGDSDTFYIGNQSPTLGEYFIMRDGINTVYTIYEFKVDTLCKPVSYYREFNRFNVNIDDITNIKIIRQDESVEVKIVDKIDENTNNVWEMVSPYACGANDDYIDNKILEPIRNINLSTPISDTEGGITDKSPILTLKIKPYDEITGKYDDEYTETLAVGSTINGKTYVKYKDNIYSSDSESLSFVNESSFNIVSKMQALVDISTVKRVTLEYNGESHSIDISRSGNAYNFKADGDNADERLSKMMYQAIISLAVDGVYNGETLGDVIFRLTYEGNDSADNTIVEFSSINDLSCALTRNGKTEFTIRKNKINELIDAFTSYLKNYK